MRGLRAHFRFGFFVAAALVPDALLAGASLVAGFAASRLLPANAPLLPFALLLGSVVAERFRPSLDAAAPLASTLLPRCCSAAEERLLLSVDIIAFPFPRSRFSTEVAAFFKLAWVDALVGAAAPFFASVSVAVLLFFRGDFELDLPAAALVGAAAFGFSAAAGDVLAEEEVLGGETEVLLFATFVLDTAAFLAAETDCFFASSFAGFF